MPQTVPFDPFDSTHPWNDPQILKHREIRDVLFQLPSPQTLRDLPRRPVTFTGAFQTLSPAFLWSK